MPLDLTRRDFMRTAAAGLGGTVLGAFGFGEIEAAHAAMIRPYKLARMVETRNTCPYCSVACGIIMYAPEPKPGEKRQIMHIEGDPDHPTNRGTLCPKGAALLDFVRAPTRLVSRGIVAPAKARSRKCPGSGRLIELPG